MNWYGVLNKATIAIILKQAYFLCQQNKIISNIIKKNDYFAFAFGNDNMSGT